MQIMIFKKYSLYFISIDNFALSHRDSYLNSDNMSFVRQYANDSAVIYLEPVILNTFFNCDSGTLDCALIGADCI